MNSMTACRTNMTKCPMGLAGVHQMMEDARHTHKGTNCPDRNGMRNFCDQNGKNWLEAKAEAQGMGGGDGHGVQGSVFDKIGEANADNLDRLIAIDCARVRYLQ